MKGTEVGKEVSISQEASPSINLTGSSTSNKYNGQKHFAIDRSHIFDIFVHVP